MDNKLVTAFTLFSAAGFIVSLTVLAMIHLESYLNKELTHHIAQGFGIACCFFMGGGILKLAHNKVEQINDIEMQELTP
jgi:hypothetical protein